MNFIARILRGAGPLLLLLSLSACETLSYHWQAANGHLRLMQARVPIEELIEADQTTPELRKKLTAAFAARRFAAEALGLPDNDSYSDYAEVPGSAVVHNVVAAPEFSLTPMQWCFPVAGCVNYRGYFALADAEAKAAELQAAGWEVVINRVPAYSTLGWFDDPIPSTVIDWPDDAIARLIFHELAHQRLYVPGDTRFNESFASAVALLGLREWQAHQGRAPTVIATTRRQRHYQLVAPQLEELRALYAHQDWPEEELRRQKQAIYTAIRENYRQQKNELPAYENWFAELNNARLAGLSDYTSGVPSFIDLFQQCAASWACFYQRSDEIAGDPMHREQFLNKK